MIKPEQIPPEVVATVRRNLFCNAYDACWIVAAALNAWPGMGRVEGLMDGDDVVAPPAIFLPFEQENSDD